ncbi:MAG: Mrp/NBP35 family ATP-binding protein [Leptospiraceae bacterium]|nr:Mrp/NBP35 family ATP-binding protein [Leptospiraceae bacterium]MCB1304807.1 Mrp/NBP35 family ATP-binding protein [Leptospiraceae bacterium]
MQQLESKISDALKKIEHPTYKQSLGELNMLGGLEEDGDAIKLHIKTPDPDRKIQIALEAQIRGFITKLDLPKKVKIKFSVDETLKPEDIGNRIRGVKNIIVIGSGKGGVGKSTVSANLAAAMAAKGLKVGLLDADIYGPSIGKMFGLSGKQPLFGDGQRKVEPPMAHGVKVISFSFLLNPDQAVIWRGPMLGKAVEQFLYEIIWGELDYLLIDLPPGTGDVQLSLAQLVDLDGAIIVTTPQNVAIQDATRAVAMFQEVKIPILGIIENMSEFVCPHCGKSSHIFSKNGGPAFAAKYRVPFLGDLPLMTEIMESGEEGTPFAIQKESPVQKSYNEIIDRIGVEVERYR